jgi:hypothetical protein
VPRRSFLWLLPLTVLLLGAGTVLIVRTGHVTKSLRALPVPATPSPTTTPPPPSLPAYPATGPNTYLVAPADSVIFGTAGALVRYRVAVEAGSPVAVEEFAAVVDATLSDPRSWIAGHDVRLQRIAGEGYAFTVYLVTPGTAERLCAAGGFDIVMHGEPYTSCRVGGRVVINLARYLTAIPDYGAALQTYRQYAINHEVGHALGHDHELCPGQGRPAPVMQQQTFGLQGCVANAWPYLDGHRYAGPFGQALPSD